MTTATHTQGRLRIPELPPAAALPTGRSHILINNTRAGLLQLPAGRPDRLVVLLHGAGQDAQFALGLLSEHAEEHNLVLYAPKSIGATWDMLRGGFGPDVARIEAAVSQILAALDAPRPALTVGGFSDGASYALTLGLTNGDLFDSVLAYSPGFAAPTVAAGKPAIYISHGTADRILPIDRCSRRLVPALTSSDYPVRYDEFSGGHEVPAGIVDASLGWLSGQGH